MNSLLIARVTWSCDFLHNKVHKIQKVCDSAHSIYYSIMKRKFAEKEKKSNTY